MNANDQANDPNWRPQPRETIENRVVQVRQQRNPGYALILVLLFILLAFGGSTESYLVQEQLKSTLDSLIYQSTNYSAWLNGTASNFTSLPTDHSAFTLLDLLLPRDEPLDPYFSSYYRNVSGFLQGSVKVHNLSAPVQPGWSREAADFFNASSVNQTELSHDIGNFNWTSVEHITISIQEQSPLAEDITIIHGSIVFNSNLDSTSVEMRLEGVHYPSRGTFYSFAEAKLESHLIDLRHLPSIVPSDLRNATAKVISLEFLERIERLKALMNSDSVDIETHDVPADTHCHFQLYGQLNPSVLSDFEMQELESEMQKPTGAHVPLRPPLYMDALLLSKNCGLVYQANHLKGIKTQIFWRRATTYAGVAFLLYLALLTFFVKQSKYAASRRALSRLSFWTFLIQSSTDAMVFTSHASFGIIEENRASLSLLGPGFLACILLINEAQYVLSIRQVQSPEQADTMGIIQSVADLLMRIPGVARLTGSRSGLIIVSFIALAGLFSSIYSPNAGFWILGMIYSSVWWPQIIRSARRNLRKPLLKRYVFFTSLCRLFFLLYLFGCPENIIGTDQTAWVWVFVALIAVQNIIIFLQEYLGPAFFLPSGWWTESVHDYHPIMSLPDEENPDASLGDCSICMEPIYVLPENSEEKGGRLKVAANRRTYAVAPCHHLFHSRCLEQWMTVKSICPHCRRGLPAL